MRMRIDENEGYGYGGKWEYPTMKVSTIHLDPMLNVYYILITKMTFQFQSIILSF